MAEAIWALRSSLGLTAAMPRWKAARSEACKQRPGLPPAFLVRLKVEVPRELDRPFDVAWRTRPRRRSGQGARPRDRSSVRRGGGDG